MQGVKLISVCAILQKKARGKQTDTLPVLTVCIVLVSLLAAGKLLLITNYTCGFSAVFVSTVQILCLMVNGLKHYCGKVWLQKAKKRNKKLESSSPVQ